MYYEPVTSYIVEYEISAIFFLAVIMVRYFSTRRFPNQKNRLFSFILCSSFADLVLDVIGSYTIENALTVPAPITYTVNAVFYGFQILLPILMTTYTLALSRHLSLKKEWRLLLLFLPGILIFLMLLVNPITKWFFYIDPVQGYVHGKMFMHTYAACFFCLIVTFFVALHNRAVLRKDEFRTIIRFLCVILVSIAIQYVYPALLISGVGIALAVILMYFAIQNPESMLDAATGAFTYEAMMTFLHDRAAEREHVRLIAVKIGNMSRINELLGIENGSQLLSQIRQLLQECADDTWVFRMREDCLVAVTRNLRELRLTDEQLEQRISQPWAVGNTGVLVQATICSVKTSELMGEPLAPQQAMNNLDLALAKNDHRGKRVISICIGPEQLRSLKRRQVVEAALRDAIENDEGLELYFQPLWSVRQQKFTSAEVLLRFNHPQLGMVSPEEFVPIAENCGIVTAMDELVLKKACAFIRERDPRRTLGLEMLEINLSALEFMHFRLPELLNEVVMQHGIDPEFVCFEITETAATESFDLLKESMLKLCQKGFRFALDDFGTGYANISRVIQLPFSMVKLDRSLLYGSTIVLEDLARMFARMGRFAVIEGVETPEQAAQVQAVQADYIQGFYYAKPMNEQDFIAFFRDHNTFS